MHIAQREESKNEGRELHLRNGEGSAKKPGHDRKQIEIKRKGKEGY